jgi:hypothetical protein
MNSTVIIGSEIVFNVAYLVVIWVLVALMIRRRPYVSPGATPVSIRFVWAFALLAFGDTGHVGLRVLAYASGGLEAHSQWVGLGALSTAITVTLFYMLMADIWRRYFNQPIDWRTIGLWAVGVIRLGVLTLPQNGWDQAVAPYGWSLLRNGLLVIQGIGVLVLLWRSARQTHDRLFRNVAIMIALSFLFYSPVILWVQRLPLLGMLMIPKTCAYIAIAVLAYQDLFGAAQQAGEPFGSKHR